MPKLRTLVLLLVAVLAFGSAAGKDPKPAADYFPLRVGDSWTYRNTESGGYTWKVLREEPQEGGAVRYIVEFRSGVIIESVFSKADGWVLLHTERYTEHETRATYDPPKQYLPDPLAPGKKWEWSGKDVAQNPRHESSQVVGFENVTVPAGKFRALKVVAEVSGGTTPMTRTFWYADGVGLVKTTTQGGEIKYGSELADYSFKKK